jgi:hypothetical protein
MSTSIANLSWPNVPGSVSTLVEYKLSTSPTWIQPPSPQNPTPNNFYPLQITDGLLYDVRLTTNGLTCGPSATTLQIMNGSGNNCCPTGYTASIDGTYCYQRIVTPATPPSASDNTVAVNHADYSAWGSLIFDPGYALNGTGAFTQIPYTNSFWVNGAGFPSGAGANTTQGPLNRNGVWVASPLSGQSIGFTVCVNAPVAGTYYVGTAGDNYSTIVLDGDSIIVIDPASMATYLNANGYGGLSTEVAFRFWFIYPINLTAGEHIIEVIGLNISGPASVGAEVYNATSAEITAATSYADLGPKLLFSSKDYIGQPVQIGTGGVGYTCAAAGSSLVLCDGSPYCLQLLTTNPIPCSGAIIYYGAKGTAPPPDAPTILAGSSTGQDATLDVTIDWRPFNASPQYIWFAIPNVGPVANKNQWYVDTVNQGAIGGLSNLFGDPTHVTVSGLDYFVWITNYQTQFVQVAKLMKV